ncbi:MAG: flagellar motor switch protein FliG [Candidatus Latescibacteria bacterium]|nr:flagellar motor switch protein FliG [Candidatus Latescibacterota bacterium]MBT4139445.1 flagellar motor switch protein FliG [Candidatus Latescibacterota bacterium]MBT5832272.1 flagellar motor switch protein FliG [Candidatus Latescibacterota bacterium]
MNKPIEQLTALEKVAILLIALGEDTTVEILKHMHDSETEKIAATIATVQHVDTHTMDQVLEDFESLLRQGQFVSQGGREFAHAALELAMGSERAEQVMARIGQTVSGLTLLKNADANQILPIIRKEQAQTIALILTQIPPSLAADILVGLSEEQQAEVSYRMATISSIEPEALRELEENLALELQDVLSGHVTDFDGPKVVADILNRAQQDTEFQVLDHIAQHDPELAESIREEMFVFDDLRHLSDQDMQILLKEIDANDLALALKNANETIKNRFFANLSQNRVNRLKEEIEFLGKVRLSEVQEAQQRVAQMVREYQESGQLRIVRADSNDML